MKRAREAAAMRMFDGCTIQPLDRHAQNVAKAAATIREQQLAFGRRVLENCDGEDCIVDLDALLDEEGV